MKTLCIGEILWDIFPDKKVWGGAPVNFIFHTAQMGADATAYSAIGDDELGRSILTATKDCGINLIAPSVDYPTGKVDIIVDKDGDATYRFNDNCAWDHIPASLELRNLSANADLIAFGSLAQRSAISRATIFEALIYRKPECKVLFDANLRQNFYSTEIIQKSLEECDFLKVNEKELPIICDLLGVPKEDLINRFNIELIILTLGPQGSHIISKDQSTKMAATPCQIVDTVGAGDSFTANFIINYLQGMSILEAQKLASNVAAYVCGHTGANVPIPEELRPTLKLKQPMAVN